MHTLIKTYQFKLYQSRKLKHLEACINLAAEIWNWCIALPAVLQSNQETHLRQPRQKAHYEAEAPGAVRLLEYTEFPGHPGCCRTD